ncbi:sulfotransferase [Lysobacter korlensis]|uniref:Sulfotransferase n=1 Tax=Lysobacter korlensis TaxID=553636 RepID=A0ABV6S202_9GAMM
MASSFGAAPPDSFERQVETGFRLLSQGRVVEAARLADALIASGTTDPQALLLGCEVRLAQGNPQAALHLISRAVDVAPGQVRLLLRKAHALALLRRRLDARNTAAEAVAVAGDDAQALVAAGRIYGSCDDPASARDVLLKVIEPGSSDPALLYDLAGAQFFTGDFAAAERNLDAVLRVAPQAGHAIYLRSTLRRQTPRDNHVADLESRLRAGFADPSARAACLYALAKELEDLSQDDRSFAVLSQAAALKRKTLRYDVRAECSTIDAIRSTYSTPAMHGVERPGSEGMGEDIVFIVGMPRTGTTLVERMLGRHSDVRSAGELPDFGEHLAAAVRGALAEKPGQTPVEASLSLDFESLGHAYLETARQAAPGSRVVVDKMPINFMYCGLIRKALPAARIVHLVRDPMDSCYAIYKTMFNQAYFFSYDLDELATYYATYRRIMAHWHAAMPGSILDVHYEDVVTDIETQARRIIDWCGLEWQSGVVEPSDNEAPSTTASAAQVRQAVYTTSVQKWRRHANGLEPLRMRLVDAGIVAK